MNLVFSIGVISLLVAAEFSSDIIKDRYIVTLKQNSRASYSAQLSGVDSLLKSGHTDNGINHRYQKAIYGFSAKMDSQTVQKLRNDPEVERISPVRLMRVAAAQQNATWGISRLSTRSKLENPPYAFRYKDNGGSGVDVYVLDTGININHVEFEGRARWGTTIIKNGVEDDIDGHGTHCAGTIAGKTYGVAKKANVIAVKLLEHGVGPDEDTIAAIEWVMNNRNPYRHSVMSLSLGLDYPDSDTSHEVIKALNNAYDQGIISAVAAGNDYQDACKYSPAKAEKVITVGATDINDNLSSFSNYGKCVDILAPGSRITSAWVGSSTAINTISGTSMATPHIAGLTAALLSSGVQPSNIKDRMYSVATKDAISKLPPDTVNLLAYYPVY